MLYFIIPMFFGGGLIPFYNVMSSLKLINSMWAIILPAALAPDQPYDSFGCFSGSAIELNDGRQLLLYTGVRKEGGDKEKEYQTQCIAVGDGLNYKKSELNPVLIDSKSTK